jgi:flagellar hook assembly protein FlgD
VTSVKEPLAQNEAPANYILHQNFPNPFNAGTTIRFEIPSSRANTTARLAIYNVRGELVCELINQKLPAGNYFVHWEGKNNAGREVASGIYLCRLRLGNMVEMRKLSLLK